MRATACAASGTAVIQAAMLHAVHRRASDSSVVAARESQHP